MKHQVCTIKGCINKGKYCRIHPSGHLNLPKPLPKRSASLEKIMRKQYRPQVKEMVEKGTLCAVKSPVCIKIAQGFHHLQGRGKNLMKKKIPCCNPCNQFIEKNDAWARARGLKLSKFAPDNQPDNPRFFKGPGC
jgi:hypothetical protein